MNIYQIETINFISFSVPKKFYPLFNFSSAPSGPTDKDNDFAPVAVEYQSIEGEASDVEIEETEDSALPKPLQSCNDQPEGPSNILPDSEICNRSEHKTEDKFTRPSLSASTETKLNFIEKHPVQPDPLKIQLPFDACNLYFRTQLDGERIKRKWLSYSVADNKIFCSFCMCYDNSNSRSPFADGGCTINVKNIYDKVVKHEQSQVHTNCVNAYIMSLAHKDVESLFNNEAKSKRQHEVLERRKVVHRVIDMIIYLAKQNIAF